MSDNGSMNQSDGVNTTPGASGEVEYTETVVEYVDNRQRKVMLVALISVLVVLMLLLIAAVFAIFYFSRGTGAPSSSQTPEGIEWVRSIYGWGRTADTSLVSPSDVAVARDGSIWAISGARTIVGFNPDGSLKKLISPKRGGNRGEVDTLEGITVARNGTIYVTDQGANGRVSAFDQDGKYVGAIPATFSIEVATDGADKLGVTGKDGYGVISVDGLNAKVLGVWGARGKGLEQFDLPHGVAFGKDGRVFISDTQNKRVKALDKNGKLLWVAGGIQAIDGSQTTSETANIFELPTGLTVDGAGRVVVTDAFKFNITALDPDTGKVLGKWGEDGAADGYFGYPTGIDYDKGRDWFVVADTANNRLQILRIPGSGGTPLAALRRSLVGPVWICCIPLFLLLVIVAAIVLRRRAQRAEGEDAASDGDSGAASAAE